jgi:anti-sigma regulatory factor (Ser/Thr protein kinase)
MAHLATTSRPTWAPGSLPLEGADVQLSLSARPENVAVVRHVMGAFADVLGLSTRTAEDLRLAITEACTNVVRHAYGERGGRMDISVAPHRDRLEVAVADSGRGIAPSTDRKGPGLGLPMMATLADSLEIDRTVHAGSRVTMTFARHPARAA